MTGTKLTQRLSIVLIASCCLALSALQVARLSVAQSPAVQQSTSPALAAQSPTLRSKASGAEAVFQEAVDQYRRALDTADRDARIGHFERAELLFQQLAGGTAEFGNVARDDKAPIRNADLLINLGNAGLGAEHLGRAILAYRRALLLDPNHTRAAQNLSHARGLLPSWVPQPEEEGLLEHFAAPLRQFSVGQRSLTASISFFIAALLAAASIRWQRPLLRNLAILSASLWIILLAVKLTGGTGRQDREAVVTAPQVTARAADSDYAPVRFAQPLPAGTEVTILEDRDTWSHVRLADGRDGWIHRSAIERIGGE